MAAVLVTMVLAAAGSGLVNVGFDNGLDGWSRNASAPVIVDAAKVDGRTAGHIVVPTEAEVGWPNIHQQLPGKPGMGYEAAAEVMHRGVSIGFGAYVAVEFYDAGGVRMSYGQSDFVSVSGRWVRLSAFGVAPPGCESVRVCLVFNGHGEGWFDSVTLVETEGMDSTPVLLDGPVTVRVTDDVACAGFRGFGAEDDGWFYNPDNAEHGVGAEDVKLREERIASMSPDYVRMFCWYKDWNPSGDWATFTFDSPNMLSRYKTLDLYQRLGATVNLTGVEWGIEQPYREPEKLAKALGALFDELIRVRGYTCVREWTLTNEPNTNWVQRGDTFEGFVKIHQLVKAEFASRGLEVAVVGSDDTAGATWFRQCVEDSVYFEAVDLFVSHRYFPFADRGLSTRFYAERLSLLREKAPVKPFVVGEFGFQDARSTAIANPIMEEYRYAIWTAAFTIEGLNAGAAGFSIWSLHEMYYPGGFVMNYALWNFKDRGWSPRPVFYAWSNFCRMTKAGDKVYKCESSYPRNVSAAKVGDVLFWVNCGDGAAEVRLEGMEIREVRTYTEGPGATVSETGSMIEMPGKVFQAPPESFGFCR